MASRYQHARALLVIGLLLAPGLALGCGKGDRPAAAAAPAGPPPTVYVAAVERRDLPIALEAVATLDGYVNAEIRARVRGFLKAQSYKDGAFVKTGQPLFTIESDQYAAVVRAARAGLSRAKAAGERERVLLERSEGLNKTGMVSQQDLDDVRTGVTDAAGRVEAAQADLARAELDLSYTQIRAPIAGVAGVALVRIGNLVGQEGPTLLTTISQLDPMRVSFALSEIDFLRYPDEFKRFDGRDIGWAKRQFARASGAGAATTEQGEATLELLLSDGRSYPHRGVIVSADRQIDSSTGTITLQALFPNPDGLLRPGQYGRVRMPRNDQGRGLLVVPDKALIPVQGSYSVGVVGDDDTVQLRRIELGPGVPGLRAVTNGLKQGERVVVEGVQKISDGVKVKPVAAPPEPAPKPETKTDPAAKPGAR